MNPGIKTRRCNHILSVLAGLAAFALPWAAGAAGGPDKTAEKPAEISLNIAAASSTSIRQVNTEMREAIQSSIAKVFPALVRIQVVTSFPGEGRLSKEEAAGSGAIITKEGHVITNHHVAGRALRAVCRMPDGEEIEASLVGTDPLADISVLKLNVAGRANPKKELPVASFGDSTKIHVGDRVLAMGSPMGMSQTVTLGIVSNTALMLPVFAEGYFEIDGEQTGTLVRWIGHDASIFGGNSGGPLVSFDGEIIGINEMGVAGIGGAIPADLAKSVAEQIIQTGVVRRSWIGAGCQPLLKGSKQDKGTLVSSVIAGSPAAKASMLPGDILLEFDGVPTDARIREDIPRINQIVQATPPDKKVSVTVLRDGKTKSLTLTTEIRDKAHGKDEELRSWGMTAENLTRFSALNMLRPDTRGVVVGTLRSGGPAAEAKPALQPGDILLDINGKPVENIKALRAVCTELTKGKDEPMPLLVRFDRNFLQLMTVVKVGKEPPKEEPALAKKPWLSAATQVLTGDLAKALGLEGKTGVRVTRVFPGHAADKAGLKVGDILLKLDGDPIEASRPEDSAVLTTLIRQRRIGASAEFDAVRAGKPLKIKLPLEAPPAMTNELKHYEDEEFEFSVREMSYEERLDRQMTDKDGGVLIDMVQRAGWAAIARVQSGDVLLAIDGKPVETADAVKDILKKTKSRAPKQVVFFVKRGIQTVYLEIEPIWEKNGHNGKKQEPDKKQESK